MPRRNDARTDAKRETGRTFADGSLGEANGKNDGKSIRTISTTYSRIMDDTAELRSTGKQRRNGSLFCFWLSTSCRPCVRRRRHTSGAYTPWIPPQAQHRHNATANDRKRAPKMEAFITPAPRGQYAAGDTRITCADSSVHRQSTTSGISRLAPDVPSIKIYTALSKYIQGTSSTSK